MNFARRWLVERRTRTAVVEAFGALLLWDTARTTFETDRGTHSWLDIVVLAFVAQSFVVGVLLPRQVAKETQRLGLDQSHATIRVSALRFAVSMSPTLIAFALEGAGADHWPLSVAVLGTVVQLVGFSRVGRPSST